MLPYQTYNGHLPFIFPYHIYGFILLYVYLLIPHTKRPWLYALRWPLHMLIWLLHLQTLLDSRHMTPLIGFFTGLLSTYGMALTSTWLWWNKPQFDAKRIQIRVLNKPKSRTNAIHEIPSLASGNQVNKCTGMEKPRGYRSEIEGNHDRTTGEERQGPEIQYYWQDYPESLIERIDWVISLILSRKGTRWNWRIPTLPPLPESVSRSLRDEEFKSYYSKEKPHELDTTQYSFTGSKAFKTTRQLYHDQVRRLLPCGVAISFSLWAMTRDPYFAFGPSYNATPEHLNYLHPWLLKCYRQLLAFTVLACSLSLVGTFLIAILPLTISQFSSLLDNSIYASPWLYPTWFGSSSLILQKGLNGLWGSWWHQEFRHIFASPVAWFIQLTGTNSRSQTTKVLGLLSAFTISGLLHMGLSTSSIRGITGWRSFFFFIAQAGGIFLQTTFCSVFRPQIVCLPMWLRKTCNGLFVLFWLMLTADLMLDDFASLGLWFDLLEWKARGRVEIGWNNKARWWWERGVAIE